MQQGRQKKSLFSQRIKQSRLKTGSSQDSFPKAVKITVEAQQPSELPEAPPTKGQPFRGGFVSKLLRGTLKEEQVSQIEKDNMNSIAGMSPQQIDKYRELILREMPASFTSRVLKQSHNTSVKQQTSQPMIEQVAEQTKMVDQAEPQQPQVMHQNKNSASLSGLYIDINSMSLHCIRPELQLDPHKCITMDALKLMVESQNNQTQIIAAKLVAELCRSIYAESRAAGIPLYQVEGTYFHRTQLAWDIYTQLLGSMVHQIRRTKFKSCWVELLLGLIRGYGCIKRDLVRLRAGKISEEIVEVLRGQVGRVSQFLDNQQMELKEKSNQIGIEYLCNLDKNVGILSDQITQLKKQRLSVWQASQDPLIRQIIRIELTELPTTLSFPILLQELVAELSSSQDKVAEANKILFNVAVHLHRDDMRSGFMNQDMEGVKQGLLQFLKQLYANQNKGYTLQSLCEGKQQQVLTKLMILKVLSPLQYVTVFKPNQTTNLEISIASEDIANVITFMNIDEYLRSPLPNQEQKNKQLDDLHSTFQYLTNNIAQGSYLSPIADIVFIELLALFELKLDPAAPESQALWIDYHSVNSQILQQLLSTLCLVLQPAALWSALPDQKVKALVESYNYDSFGNETFTRLLFYLMGSCPRPGLQAMLIEEILARYPFLFYYAVEGGCYGHPGLYCEGEALEAMRDVVGMLEVAGKLEDRQNMLVRYLTKQ